MEYGHDDDDEIAQKSRKCGDRKREKKKDFHEILG